MPEERLSASSISENLCRELGFVSASSATSLAFLKACEVKCNNPNGHAEEMFLHQLALPPMTPDLFVRVHAANLIHREDGAQRMNSGDRVKMCTLATALAQHFSRLCLPADVISRAACEVSAACICDDHPCDLALRQVAFEMVNGSAELTAAERAFLLQRLEAARWK